MRVLRARCVSLRKKILCRYDLRECITENIPRHYRGKCLDRSPRRVAKLFIPLYRIYMVERARPYEHLGGEIHKERRPSNLDAL